MTALVRRARSTVLFMLLAVALVGLFGQSGAQAATDGRQITQYDLIATVDADGVVNVELTFVFDYGNDPGHGPYLEFVTRKGYDDASDRLYEYRNIEVHSPSGAPANLHLEDNGWNLYVRIGDPNIGDVSGAQTYVLSYELVGMLNDETSTDSGMDEFFWNVLGGRWEIPISNVSVLARTDFGVDAVAADCFSGPAGSTQNCDLHSLTAEGAVFTQDDVPVGSQLTIVVGWPGDTWTGAAGEEIAPLLVPVEASNSSGYYSESDDDAGPFAIVLSALVGVAGSVILGRKIKQRRYDEAYVGVVHGELPRQGDLVQVGKQEIKLPVTVRFNPPEGVTPAEAGVVIDERAEEREFAATLIDLAVRGYLVIEEVPPERDGGKVKDWLLTPTGANLAGLAAPHERELLTGLLPSGPVHMSTLRRSSGLAVVYQSHNNTLNSLMEERGIFKKNPAKARSSWGVKGGLLLVTAFFAMMFSFAADGGVWAFTVPAVLGALGIATIATSKYAPVRTATGSVLLAQTVGFEQYLSVAEGEQLRFEEGQDIFSKYLPYAIAFGNTEQWTKRFSAAIAQGQMPEQSWYRSSQREMDLGNFMMMPALLKSINDTTTKSVQVQTAENSASGGSSGGSGFSGGGSSGGGGGGGGGGGW